MPIPSPLTKRPTYERLARPPQRTRKKLTAPIVPTRGWRKWGRVFLHRNLDGNDRCADNNGVAILAKISKEAY